MHCLSVITGLVPVIQKLSAIRSPGLPEQVRQWHGGG